MLIHIRLWLWLLICPAGDDQDAIHNSTLVKQTELKHISITHPFTVRFLVTLGLTFGALD